MTRWALALPLFPFLLPFLLVLVLGLSGCAPSMGSRVGYAGHVDPYPTQASASPPFAASPLAPLPPAGVSASAPPVAASATDGSAGVDATGLSGASGDELAALDEDDDEQAPGAPPVATQTPAPALSDAEIDRRFHHDLPSLGSASVGPAHAGALVNGVPMPRGDHWQLLDAGHAWGTQETVDALVRCIERVNERYPGAPPLAVGHLSARNGGHLWPHKSHQSGRDADVGYYYKAGARPFVHATEDNLDLPRTWALLKAALRETVIDMIFIDRAVQRALADYAMKSGEDAAFLDEVFQIRGHNPRAPVRHIRGHDNHIHFRFHNPAAEEMGRRVARFVVIPKAPPVRVAASQAEAAGYVPIRAHSGDTLVILARRYGTTVEEIQRANQLAGNAIRAGIVYKIPQKVAPRPIAKLPSRVAQRRGGGGGAPLAARPAARR